MSSNLKELQLNLDLLLQEPPIAQLWFRHSLEVEGNVTT